MGQHILVPRYILTYVFFSVYFNVDSCSCLGFGEVPNCGINKKYITGMVSACQYTCMRRFLLIIFIDTIRWTIVL